MEPSLKRKFPGSASVYKQKQVKTEPINYKKLQFNINRLKALTPRPADLQGFVGQGKSRTRSQSVCLKIGPIVLNTEKRATERAVFDSMCKEIQEKRIEEKRVLKEISEKAEIEEIKLAAVFKARPMPEYRSPMKPMKSLKKLTVPIEQVFQTDIRAHIRHNSSKYDI
jgi:hypothetical protein